MNPIEQAIEVMERVVRGEAVYESGIEALAALKAHQQAAQDVELPPLPGDISNVFTGPIWPHICAWAELAAQGIAAAQLALKVEAEIVALMRAYARAAIAAHQARQAASTQPPLTAELHCVCGAEWRWENREWELLASPIPDEVPEARQAVPQGWRDAIQAALDAWYRFGTKQPQNDAIEALDSSDEFRALRAMLAAAPTPEATQPDSIAKLDNCGRYYAKDNAGQWHHLNHTDTWQPCPPIDEATQPAASKVDARLTDAVHDALTAEAIKATRDQPTQAEAPCIACGKAGSHETWCARQRWGIDKPTQAEAPSEWREVLTMCITALKRARYKGGSPNNFGDVAEAIMRADVLLATHPAPEQVERDREAAERWQARFETLHALYEYRPSLKELDAAFRAAREAKKGEA